MESPFNFPMQLLTDGEGAPVPVQILQSRASGSRRGGHVLVLGVAQEPIPTDCDDRALVKLIKKGKAAPVAKIRLEMN